MAASNCSVRIAGEHRLLRAGSESGGVPGHGAAREHRLQRGPRGHLERHHLHRPRHRRVPRRQLLRQVPHHPRVHRLLPRRPGAADGVGGGAVAAAGDAVPDGGDVPAGEQDAVLRLLRGAVPDLHRHGRRQVGAAAVRRRAVRRRRRGAARAEAVLLQLVLRRHQPGHLHRRHAHLLAPAERGVGARLRRRHRLPGARRRGVRRRDAVVPGAGAGGEPAPRHPPRARRRLPEAPGQAARRGGPRRGAVRARTQRQGRRRRRAAAAAGAHQGAPVPGQGRRRGGAGDGREGEAGGAVGPVHGERGGGREDPGADAAHLAHLRAVRRVTGADDHHLHPARDGHGHPPRRRLLQGARGLPRLRRGGLHAPLGAAPRRRRHPAGPPRHGPARRAHAAAAHGRGPVPRRAGPRHGGPGRAPPPPRRRPRRRCADEHRVAGAAVRSGGRVRRLLRHRAARVLLRRGARRDAQHLLRLLLPRALAGLLRQLARRHARRRRHGEARLARAQPQRRTPRLLLLALDDHQRRQPAALHGARLPVHAQAGGRRRAPPVYLRLRLRLQRG